MVKMYSLVYNSINHTLFWLGDNYRLNLVIMSKYGEKERSVVTSYIGSNNAMNYYVTPKWFLSISNSNKENPVNFTVSTYNMWQFSVAISEVSKWLMQPSTFTKDSAGRVKVTEAYHPVIVSGNNGTSLKFHLGSRFSTITDEYMPGVFIIVNDSDDVIFMNPSLFLNLKYILDHTDLHSLVFQIMNYLDRFDETHKEVDDTNNTSSNNNNNKSSFFIKERESSNLNARKTKRKTKKLKLDEKDKEKKEGDDKK